MKKYQISLLLASIFFSCILTSCNFDPYAAILENPEVIQTYPCKEKVHFDESGKIVMFILSEDHEILGNIIPEGSQCAKDRNSGFMIYLFEDINIQGYLASSKKRWKQWHVSIDSNGKLKRFMPVNDIEIDGIPCGNNEWIDLFPNGQLKHGRLSKDLEIDGILYKNDTWIEIDNNGNTRKIGVYNRSMVAV